MKQQIIYYLMIIITVVRCGGGSQGPSVSPDLSESSISSAPSTQPLMAPETFTPFSTSYYMKIEEQNRDTLGTKFHDSIVTDRSAFFVSKDEVILNGQWQEMLLAGKTSDPFVHLDAPFDAKVPHVFVEYKVQFEGKEVYGRNDTEIHYFIFSKYPAKIQFQHLAIENKKVSVSLFHALKSLKLLRLFPSKFEFSENANQRLVISTDRLENADVNDALNKIIFEKKEEGVDVASQLPDDFKSVASGLASFTEKSLFSTAIEMKSIQEVKHVKIE